MKPLDGILSKSSCRLIGCSAFAPALIFWPRLLLFRGCRFAVKVSAAVVWRSSSRVTLPLFLFCVEKWTPGKVPQSGQNLSVHVVSFPKFCV